MGSTQHTFAIEQGWIYCVAFSSKGFIAAGADDNSITLWDSSMSCQICRLEGHPGKLRALAFSPNGKYLAVASARTLRIWDVDTQPEKSHDIEHDNSYIRSVSFSWNGELLATGADDMRIRIWDSWQEAKSDNCPLIILKGHTDEVNSVAFSPEARAGYLASGSDDKTSKIWALQGKEKPQCILTLTSHNPVNSVSFSPNGLWLVSGRDDGVIDIWDTVKGDKLETMSTNTSSIQSIAFSPTGAYLASASSDHGVYLWDVVNKNVTKDTYIESTGVNEPVSELVIAPDGKTIATGHMDGRIALWKIDGKDVLPTMLPFGHRRQIYCLAFSPDGSSIASGSSDSTARICKVAADEEPAVFNGHSDWVRSVAWSPGGKYVASGSDDRSVHIYKANDRTGIWEEDQVVNHSDVASNWVRAVAFSPSEEKLYLAAGSDNGGVVIWKKAEGSWESQYTINAHSDYVRSIVFTPDGRRIVSAADNQTLRIWDLEAKSFVGETINTPTVHTRMRFEKGRETWGYVVTPHGAQSLDPSTKPVPDWCPYGERMDDEGHWITWNNEKVVFLPEEFSPGVMCFIGYKLIIGTTSGFVFGFQFPETGFSHFY